MSARSGPVPLYLSSMRIACATLGLVLVATPLPAQSGRTWRPEDRVVIGDWTRVNAVATGPERVYLASPQGVLAWRPVTREWEGPWDAPVDGMLGQVVAGIADPLDYSLWLRTLTGWVHFQPDLQVWEPGSVGGRVLDFAFDQAAPEDGLYIRTTAGWQRVPRGALISVPSNPPARPLRPATVEQAAASNPALRGSAPFLLDPTMRSARLTSAARSFDNLGWYLGTSGVGALYLADGDFTPVRLPFGLGGSVVTALYAVPGGVWAFTSAQEGVPAALTLLSSNLGSFATSYGPPATGLPFTMARQVIGAGNSLWAATDGGLIRFPVQDPAGFTRYGEADGLPDLRVSAVASRHGIVVAATRRGLVRLVDSTRAERLAPQFVENALAVAIADDTIWIATANGPRGALPDRVDLIRPAALDVSASLVRPVYALTWLADTLVGATSDQLFWKLPAGSEWITGVSISGQLGELRRLVPDGDGIWVAGRAGVGWTPIAGAPARPLLVGADLPGEPLDLAVDGTFLWVGTTAGLVRFRLDAVR